MGDNKKLLNLNEQKFAELEASNTNSQIQKTTNASLKNLETQIGQLALNLQNQMKYAFPSDTKKNPKDCMAVQLKSGKNLEEKTEKDESNKGEEGLDNAETLDKQRKKEQLTRYSNLDFICLLSSEIVLNGSNCVIDAKRLEISVAEMRCP